MSFTPWPHQVRAINETLAAYTEGVRRVCVTSPTGGGKTWIMGALAKHFLDQELGVVLYTNKRILLSQTSTVFEGIDHGIRAAGHAEDKEFLFQVASVQTEHSRVTKKKTRMIHNARLVLVDEAHLQKGAMLAGLIESHRTLDEDCLVVLITATPLNLEEMADRLIVAGNMDELRECGALVRAKHFGADEPDIRAMRAQAAELKNIDGDGYGLSENQVRHIMMTKTIFARVRDWYDRLNPDRRPSILFAPGVQESLFFAEDFHKHGVPAAHIASDGIWMNGIWLPTVTPTEQAESTAAVIEASRTGEVKVVCNRFVMREGVNMPWLEHCILATVFSDIQAYIQVGGRILRSAPGKAGATIQDHGGNWWRFGSVNDNREWHLTYTSSQLVQMEVERQRDKTEKDREPRRCPKCAAIVRGRTCSCGYALPEKKSRPVVQVDGTLREMTGDLFKRRRRAGDSAIEDWIAMYWRSKPREIVRKRDGKTVIVGKSRTFAAAAALFAMEHDWAWPRWEWPFMPRNFHQRFWRIEDVPMDELTHKGGRDAL